MAISAGNIPYSDYATMLRNMLGSEYGVEYMPGQGNSLGFFHLMRTDQHGYVTRANLRLKYGAPSDFFDIDNGKRRRIPAMELATGMDPDSPSYVIGGVTTGKYVEIEDKPMVDFQFMNPFQSTANAIRFAFEKTTQKRMRGNQNATVEGTLMQIMTEGYTEESTGETLFPHGALMVNRGDPEDLRRRAARGITLATQLDRTLKTNIMQQRQFVLNAMYGMIRNAPAAPEYEPSKPDTFFSIMQRYGYGQDRDTAYRFMPFGSGYKPRYDQGGSLVGFDPFFGATKVAKHLTVTESSRHPVTFYQQGAGGMLNPLIPGKIGSTRESVPSGYFKTTARAGGSIPESSLMSGLLFSSQYPIPGAGMYFPENLRQRIDVAGYDQIKSHTITGHVSSFINDENSFRLSSKVGDIYQNNLLYQYGATGAPGKEQRLTARADSPKFAVRGIDITVPQYIDQATGMGAIYSPAGQSRPPTVREITGGELDVLRKRYPGANIRTDPLADQVMLNLAGTSFQNAKAAMAGTKFDLVPHQGRPGVDLGGRTLPIGALGFDIKALPYTMRGAIATMPAKTQAKLLRQFASISGVSGTPTADVLSTYAKSISRRGAGPLDLDQLASDIGTSRGLPTDSYSSVQLASEIASGVFRLNEENISGRSVTALSRESWNLENLRNYNMGWVSSAIPGGSAGRINRIVDAGDVRQQRDAYVKEAMDADQNITARQAVGQFYTEYGYQRGSGALKGSFIQSFSPKGFYMPALIGGQVEFTGGGTIGPEEALMINNLSPSFAARARMSMGNPNALTSLSRNMTNPVNSAFAQIAATTIANATRGTQDQVQMTRALTVTQGMAGRMLADMNDLLKADLTQVSYKDWYKQMGTALQSYFPNSVNARNRPLTFEGANAYLPSLSAMKNVGSQDIEGGPDETRYAIMMQSAIKNALVGTINQNPSQIFSAIAPVDASFQNLFKIGEGQKSNVVRSLLGSEAQWTVTRYAYEGNLQQQQVYASKQQYMAMIRRELAGQGVDTETNPVTESEVEEIYRVISGAQGDNPYIEAHGLPGVAGRYPILGGTQEGILGVQFITPEWAKRKGVQLSNNETGLSTYHMRTSLAFAGLLGGDFDLDQAYFYLGIQAKREKGDLKYSFAGLTKEGKVDPNLQMSISRLKRASVSEQYARLFENPDQQQAFNPYYGAFVDRKGGVVGEILKQLGGANFYGYEHIENQLRTYGGAKMQMGTSYNLSRGLEAAWTLAGFSSAEQNRLRSMRAPIYQGYLDLQSALPVGAVTMYQTAHLRGSESGQVSMGWGYPLRNEGQEQAWADPVPIRESSSDVMLTQLANSAIGLVKRGKSMDVTPPNVIASMFGVTPKATFGVNALDQDAVGGYISGVMGNATTRDTGFMRGAGLLPLLKAGFTSDLANTPESRRDLMRSMTIDWFRENYAKDAQGNSRQPIEIFNTPIFQNMLGKAVHNKNRFDPGFFSENPSLSSNAFGQGLLRGAVAQTGMFHLLKNSLAPFDVLNTLSNRLKATPSPQRSNLANWAIGAIDRVLGFSNVTTSKAQAVAYDTLRKQLPEVRASNIFELATGKNLYPDDKSGAVQTPLGLRQVNSAAMKTWMYTLGRQRGLSGDDLYAFANLTGIGPDQSERGMEIVGQGEEFEAKLKGVLTSGTGWYGSRTEKARAASKGRFQGYIGTQIPIDMGNGETQMVNLGATADILSQEMRNGESYTIFNEVKSPINAAEMSGEKGKQKLQAWLTQARSSVYIGDVIAEQIRGGGVRGDVAKQGLLDYLSSQGYQGDDLNQAYENVMAGRTGYRIIQDPVGGTIHNLLDTPTPNREDVIKSIVGKGGTAVTSRGWRGGFEKMLQQAGRNLFAARDDILEMVGPMAAATPAFVMKKLAGIKGGGELISRGRQRLSRVIDAANMHMPFLQQLSKAVASSRASGGAGATYTQGIGYDQLVSMYGNEIGSYLDESSIVDPDVQVQAVDEIRSFVQNVISSGGTGSIDASKVRNVQSFSGAVGAIGRTLGYDVNISKGRSGVYDVSIQKPSSGTPAYNFSSTPPAGPATPAASVSSTSHGNQAAQVPPVVPPQPPPSQNATPFVPQPGGPNAAPKGGAPDSGKMDPTIKMQEFQTLYNKDAQRIMETAQMLNQVLGGTPGQLHTVLAGKKRSEISEIGAANVEVIDMARNLRMSALAAQRLVKNPQYNAESLDPNIEGMVADVNSAVSPIGKAMIDVLAFAQKMPGAQKFKRAIFGAAAEPVFNAVRGSGLLDITRNTFGLGLSGSLNEILSGSGFTNDQVNDFVNQIKSNPAAFQAFRALKELGNPGQMQKNLGGSETDMVAMSKIAAAIKDTPAGKELFGKENASMTQGQRDAYAALAENARKLAERFESLQSSSGGLKKAFESITDTAEARQSALLQARVKLEDAAGPLETAGVLKRVKAATAGGADTWQIDQTAQLTDDQLKQLGEFQGARASYAAVDAGLKGGPETGDPMTRLLRRTLGGFGLMYMRSLWNIGTGGLSYGMGERAQYEAMTGRTVSSATGIPYVPYSNIQELNVSKMLSGTASNPLVGMEILRAQNATVADLTSGLGAGVGAYAFFGQMAAWGGESSWLAGLGKTIGFGKIATGIGLATTVASVATRSRDTARNAYTMAFGKQTPTDFLATSWGIGFGSSESRTRFYEDLAAANAVYKGTGDLSQSLRDISKGMTPEQTANVVDQYIRATTEEYKSFGYDPEAFQTAGSFMWRNAMPFENTDTAIQLAAAGLLDEESSTRILSQMGYSSSQIYSIGKGGTFAGKYALQYGKYTQQERVMAAQSAEFYGQVGEYAQWGLKKEWRTTGGTPLMAEMQKIAALAGTVAYTPMLAEYTNWGRELVYNPSAKRKDVSWVQTPAQARAETVKQLIKSKGLDLADQAFTVAEMYYRPYGGVSGAMASSSVNSMGTVAEQEVYVNSLTQGAGYIEQRQSLGLPITPEILSAFSSTNPVIVQEQVNRDNAIQAYGELMAKAGYSQEDIEAKGKQLDTLDTMNLESQAGRAQQALSIASSANAIFGSVNKQELATSLLGELDAGKLTAGRADFLGRLYSGEPTALARAYQLNMEVPGYGKIPAGAITTDFGGFGPLAGISTGMPIFTTSANIGIPGVRGGMGPQDWIPNVFGSMDKFLGRFGGAGQAFAFGAPTRGLPGMVFGGTMGIQNYMSKLSADYAIQSAGIAAAQNNLNYVFQTGVGLSAYSGTVNPQTGSPFGMNTGSYSFNVPGVASYSSQGGGFWGAQDASRFLGYAQQEYGFDTQQRQIQMQSRFFQQNQAINQQQMSMTRGWTMQDWAYNDSMRSMQWGWQVEDYNRDVRFLTGRERRTAERQFSRQTIVHDAEEDQIDRSQERQKELWQLEDERFTIAESQHKEQVKFQEEQLKNARAFFKERKELEEEQTKLQRAYFVEMHKLQQAAIGAQAAYAKKQQEAQDLLTAVSILQLLTDQNWKDIQDKAAVGSEDISKVWDYIWQQVEKLMADIGVETTNKGTTTTTEDDDGGTGGTGSTGSTTPTDPILPPGVPTADAVITPTTSWTTTTVIPTLKPAVLDSPTAVNLKVVIGERTLADLVLDIVENEVRL